MVHHFEILKKITKLGDILFDQGWGFLVPYFLIYPFFWICNVETRAALLIFFVLHVLNLLLFLFYLPTILKRSWGWGLLFWISLFLFFLIPGAYLEYPSDPWEHFRRIFSWQSVLLFRENPFYEYTKGGYFWGWTCLFWVEPLDRRWALAFYGAFWQWLWVFQVYLFAKRVGFNNRWAVLQAAAFIFFFGNSLFGIRYYALSTLPVAYIAYLRLLILIMDFFDKNQFRFLSVLLVVPIILFNHLQELGFIFLSGFLLGLLNWYNKTTSRIKKGVAFFGVILFWGSVSLWLLHFFPGLINKTGFDFLSTLWKYDRIFFDAAGIHGLASLILAFLLVRRFSRLSILTLAPSFLLLFPLSGYFISHFLVEPFTSYRIIYAMPTSIMLVAGGKEAVGWASERYKIFRQDSFRCFLVLLLLLGLAIPSTYPFRGRLLFQIYIPPKERSLETLDYTAQWLLTHKKFNKNDILVADDLTDFVLTTHMGWTIIRPYWYHRLYPGRRVSGLNSPADLTKEVSERDNVRGFLVGIRSRISPSGPSLIAERSGHWDSKLGDLFQSIPEKFEKSAEKLTDLGWIKTFVPPFYYLYEPPIRVNNPPLKPGHD